MSLFLEKSLRCLKKSHLFFNFWVNSELEFEFRKAIYIGKAFFFIIYPLTWFGKQKQSNRYLVTVDAKSKRVAFGTIQRYTVQTWAQAVPTQSREPIDQDTNVINKSPHANMYVRTHLCMYVSVPARACPSACVCVRKRVRVCTRACVSLRARACPYARVRVPMRACVSLRAPECPYARLRVPLHTCVSVRVRVVTESD